MQTCKSELMSFKLLPSLHVSHPTLKRGLVAKEGQQNGLLDQSIEIGASIRIGTGGLPNILVFCILLYAHLIFFQFVQPNVQFDQLLMILPKFHRVELWQFSLKQYVLLNQ